MLPLREIRATLGVEVFALLLRALLFKEFGINMSFGTLQRVLAAHQIMSGAPYFRKSDLCVASPVLARDIVRVLHREGNRPNLKALFGEPQSAAFLTAAATHIFAKCMPRLDAVVSKLMVQQQAAWASERGDQCRIEISDDRRINTPWTLPASYRLYVNVSADSSETVDAFLAQARMTLYNKGSSNAITYRVRASIGAKTYEQLRQRYERGGAPVDEFPERLFALLRRHDTLNGAGIFTMLDPHEHVRLQPSSEMLAAVRTHFGDFLSLWGTPFADAEYASRNLDVEATFGGVPLSAANAHRVLFALPPATEECIAAAWHEIKGQLNGLSSSAPKVCILVIPDWRTPLLNCIAEIEGTTCAAYDAGASYLEQLLGATTTTRQARPPHPCLRQKITLPISRAKLLPGDAYRDDSRARLIQPHSPLVVYVLSEQAELSYDTTGFAKALRGGD